MEQMEELKRKDIDGNLKYLRIRVDHNEHYSKTMPQTAKTPNIDNVPLVTQESIKNYDDVLDNLQAQMRSTTNDISDVRHVHKGIAEKIEPLVCKISEFDKKI